MKSFNDMSETELKKYIKDTQVQVKNLIEDYKDKTNNMISKIHNDENLKNEAYSMSKIYKYAEWINQSMRMNARKYTRTNILPKRGEIWTCELGENIGSEENKIRPVIIIQNDTGNQNAPTTIIVPISNRPKKIAVHISILRGDFDLIKDEKMEITGTVLVEQIRVVSKVRLGRHVATLNDNFMNLLNSKIKISLEL
jgi:mRNA interferase MazF